MAWISRTGQFDAVEIRQIETMTAEQVAAAILQSDRLVALRVLSEIMLNGDMPKLQAVASIAGVLDSCRDFVTHPLVEFADVANALELREVLGLQRAL